MGTLVKVNTTKRGIHGVHACTGKPVYQLHTPILTYHLYLLVSPVDLGYWSMLLCGIMFHAILLPYLLLSYTYPTSGFAYRIAGLYEEKTFADVSQGSYGGGTSPSPTGR